MAALGTYARRTRIRRELGHIGDPHYWALLWLCCNLPNTISSLRADADRQNLPRINERHRNDNRAARNTNTGDIGPKDTMNEEETRISSYNQPLHRAFNIANGTPVVTAGGKMDRTGNAASHSHVRKVCRPKMSPAIDAIIRLFYVCLLWNMFTRSNLSVLEMLVWVDEGKSEQRKVGA